MPRLRTDDPKARIQQVAVELFAERGVQQTSLRDIAERLGVTKPALYYHFTSREALLNSLVQPLVDDFDAYVAAQEAAAPLAAQDLLTSYFDLVYKHRWLIQILIRDLGVLTELKLVDRMFEWRARVTELLIGPTPAFDAKVRAVVALGGLSDSAVMFVDEPLEALRTAAVAAAHDCLRPA
ncbi:TetR/AcrR family transcriptional regulator [Kribbella albertanoniae]|uniref:TetR/AcrR family transcriptional regulator n=1 Tax=Kribbella albertanoniae TaxID=1266829 RepID=A0A4R4PAB9_9ACTN|nr:TetR/AcrR family transcriptional regulator [Kribbella albertanoniae]TDC17222.1 TetR/AcrR family transcriptional regulator [Kribbella albertanoniae]